VSRSNSLVRALLALLLGGIMGLLPGPAYGQSVDRPDPRGDVSRVDPDTEDTTAAPARTNGDIIRTVFRHKAQRIRIRVGFADLRRSFGALYITAFVNTNEGRHREAVIAVDRAENDPWRGISWLDNGDEVVRCWVHHSLDYEHNVAIIGIPRSCLSRPRWVRIGANARIWPPDQHPAPNYRYEDNALQRNGDRDLVEPPYSARLFRG
jgi:hypothetical protein